MNAIRSRLHPLPQAARMLRVPKDWLKDEADAKRVPCLKAGDRYLFDVDAVGEILMQRASSVTDPEDEEGSK